MTTALAVQRRPLRRRISDAFRSFTRPPISIKDREILSYFSDNVRTTSGMTVTRESALTYSAVFDAVNQISSDVAKLPLNLLRRRSDGGSEPVTNSPVYRLLKTQPNPEMGAMVFRRTLTAHALCGGGGFAEIVRDGTGRPAELWPLTPDRVKMTRERYRAADGTQRLGRLQYVVDGRTTLDPADILHIQGLSYDGYCGYDVIEKAREAIGLALAAEAFGSAFFGNGATWGATITDSGNTLQDKEKREELRKKLNEVHQGPDRAWKWLILWGGLTATPTTGVDPSKAQMNELRSRQVVEVARFFNMPVHKLKDLDRATNNNIEQQDIEYYKGPILNWVTLWEEECNRKLVAPEQAGVEYFKHNANAFLRGDTAARTALYTALLDRGVFNGDQVLEFEDLNPQPGGLGKIYLVNSTNVPKDQLVELIQAKIKQSAAPPAGPAPAPAADDSAVKVARELVERADAAAAEARAHATTERERREALEASHATTVDELRASLAVETEKALHAARLEAVAAEFRVRLQTLETQLADAAAARVAAETRADDAIAEGERRVADRDQASQALIDVAEAELTRSRAEVDRLTERLNDAGVRLSASEVAVSAAAARALEAEARVVASETAAREQLAAGQVELTRCLDELRTVRATAAETEASVAQGRADLVSLQQQLDDLTRTLESATRRETEAREAVESATAAAAGATTECDRLRSDVATAKGAETELRALVTRLEGELVAGRDAAAAQLVEAQEALGRATAQAEQAARAVEAGTAAAAECERLRSDVATAKGAETELRALVTRLEGELVAGRDAAAAQLVDAREALGRAIEKAEHASDAVEAATTQAQQLRQAAERRSADLSVAQSELSAVQLGHTRVEGELRTQVATLETALAEAERARGAADASRTKAEDAVAQLTEARVAIAEDLRRVTARDREDTAAQIAAHRELVIDIMRRMVERETERASRARTTPEKLREWLGSAFYDDHEELCERALLPAMRIHLAFIGSREEPGVATRRIVRAHVEDSKRQLRTMLEGDAEDLAASFTALMARWEKERPAVVADRLMQEELRHAQTR